MSHQDQDGLTASRQLQDLKQVLDWLLAGVDLSGVAFQRDCSWTPKAFIFVAILWAWSDEMALTQRFRLARKIVVRMGIRPRPPAATDQAFLKMLRNWTARLALVLLAAFRNRIRGDLAARFQVASFTVFGVDGSRLGLPRTQSNEARFTAASVRRGEIRQSRRRARSQAAQACSARRKKADSPQMWLTLLSHLGTGLPWDWRLGPSDSSERAHLQAMAASLPEDTLVVADAGFVGYDTWKTILDGGRHLLVRVGANVRLRKGLGFVREREGLVCLWPDQQAKRLTPPLVLRLVVVQGPRHPMYRSPPSWTSRR